MKNITWPVRFALRMRLRRVQRQPDLAQALARYSPVGWSAAAVRQGDAPTYLFGGQAVLDQMPVRQDTIFRVASISKTVGTAAAMRLVKRGKLALDSDVSEVLGFQIHKRVTLRQLLTHTAALNDVPAYDPAIEAQCFPPLSEILERSFFSYEPGTRFHYSNLGAGVTGMMVEAASGMLFDDFVRQEFFVPYGLDASFHPQRIAHKERLANCYAVPGRRLTYDARAIAAQPLDETPHPSAHYMVPAGKLMISAADLLWLLQTIYTEEKEMFVRQDHIGSVRCDSGRGLGVAFADKGVFAQDRVFAGHQGCAYGAVCQAWIDPANETAAVLLTNGVRMRELGPLYAVGQTGIATLIQKVETT